MRSAPEPLSPGGHFAATTVRPVQALGIVRDPEHGREVWAGPL